MDANTIITLVGSLGFPIVACIGIFWYMTQVATKREDQTNKAIEKMTDVVAENNKVITVLTSKIDLLFKAVQEEDSKQEGKTDDLR